MSIGLDHNMVAQSSPLMASISRATSCKKAYTERRVEQLEHYKILEGGDHHNDAKTRHLTFQSMCNGHFPHRRDEQRLPTKRMVSRRSQARCRKRRTVEREALGPLYKTLRECWF